MHNPTADKTFVFKTQPRVLGPVPHYDFGILLVCMHWPLWIRLLNGNGMAGVRREGGENRLSVLRELYY